MSNYFNALKSQRKETGTVSAIAGILKAPLDIISSFLPLPEGSIIFHVDRTDMFEARKKLKARFCLSGGIPNWLLALGSPEEVRHYCKKVIGVLAPDGGYIMDASAIIQGDAKIENKC
ncbi:MAG: uroporphyrinogen decarboxylase family protein [Candidatus Bathyarchaeia archaeon]